jgi:SAM-dependent methyltransferase
MERHTDYRRRPLHILDIGGGQGHLANLLGRHFAGNTSLVNIHVVDIAAKAVRNGAMRSKRLQLTDAVKYTVADASTLLAGTVGRRVDIVVALHACGTLTDVALAHALRHQASFAICPCCYRSNGHLALPPMIIQEEDGSNKHTNDRDSGPFIGVEEFWNVDRTIRDRLQSMAELQFRPTMAGPAAHTIAALRAAATQRLNGRYQVQIKSFPVAFSTRNLCLIGSGPHTLKRQRH